MTTDSAVTPGNLDPDGQPRQCARFATRFSSVRLEDTQAAGL